ncbi:MAG: hypothetical protein JNJ54_15965 [Myxococcaceae bacterium]|nr:hypothetical protein [Myxococcaceae bacterium]
MNALLSLLILAVPDAGAGSCSVERTEAAAREASKAYCATVKDGCDLEVRAPDASGLRVVKVSLIHSRDEQGRPRFMPEGARFADVTPACQVARFWGHEVLPAPPPKEPPMPEPRRVELVQDQPVELAKGVRATLKSVLYAHATDKTGRSVNDALMQLEVTRDGKTEKVTLHRLFPDGPDWLTVAGLSLGIEYVDAYHQPSTGAVLVRQQ